MNYRSKMNLNSNFTPELLFPDQPEFDYGAFLQADNITFVDEEQGQSTTNSSNSSGKVTPPSSDGRSTASKSASIASASNTTELALQTPAQRQRLERRGHTKSRRGCYNCKRRRIKVFASHSPSHEPAANLY